MTISRVKPAGWGVGDKLTSAEQNQVDTNTTYALDKRSGQTDTLESTVALSGIVNVQSGGIISLAGATALIQANFSGAKIAATTSGATIEANAAGSKIKTLTGGRIELGDDDYPGLAAGHAGRTVTRVVSPFSVRWQSVSKLGSGTGISTFESITTARTTQGGSYVQFATVDAADSTASHLLYWLLNEHLIDGATVTSVVVNVDAVGGHGALPAFLPRIRVGKIGTGFSALHSSGVVVTDSSASVAAYEAAHAITATCDQYNTVDKTQETYYLAVWNEGGTNALAGFTVTGITITQTITDLRPH